MGKSTLKEIGKALLLSLFASLMAFIFMRNALIDKKADISYVDESVLKVAELHRLENLQLKNEIKDLEREFNEKILEQEQRYNIRIEEINKAWDNRIDDLKDIIRASK